MLSSLANFHCWQLFCCCFLLQVLCRSVTASAFYFPLFMDLFLAMMSRSSYYHTRNSSDFTPRLDTGVHYQPATLVPRSRPIVHKYAITMPSVQTFIKSCQVETSSADICAAIRHHILDQVTRSGPLASSRQSMAVKDVQMSNRPHSNPTSSYSVRGTK